MRVNIETEEYKVIYDPATANMTLQGILQLNGMVEYEPIVQLLNQFLEQQPPLIVLDLSHLELLNSSGINMISKFVIKVRQKKVINMMVKGSHEYEWQEKSLRNLQRLMPELVLDW